MFRFSKKNKIPHIYHAVQSRKHKNIFYTSREKMDQVQGEDDKLCTVERFFILTLVLF